MHGSAAEIDVAAFMIGPVSVTAGQAKQHDAVIPYLEGQKLDVWTHNKTIQKARESYRITPEQKEYLKTLKRK